MPDNNYPIGDDESGSNNHKPQPPPLGDPAVSPPLPPPLGGPTALPQNPPLATPPPLEPNPHKRRRRGCCLLAIVVFVLLCIIAAVGTYITRNSSMIPDIIRFPTQTPTTLPPAPTATPHVLPDTVDGVTQVLEPVMRSRFEPACLVKGIDWPPQRVRLVGLKAEKTLELWVANEDGPFHLLKTYPVLAASGDLGPKRREGDHQVPEGHYRLVYLNPESSFHLSLLLDYPNAIDRARESEGLADGESLGGDICVHGSNQSVGCVAVGDPAIEEIFTMAALASPRHRDILIFPADFRKRPDLISLAGDDEDVLTLYNNLVKLAETVKD